MIVYVINDIELLEKMIKFKLVEAIKIDCSIAVSEVRLHDYSSVVRNTVLNESLISILNVPKEGFDEWIIGKRKFLSISDLSSIYLSIAYPNVVLILTDEDTFLINECTRLNISYLNIDDFFLQRTKDSRLIQLFNLIKAA